MIYVNRADKPAPSPIDIYRALTVNGFEHNVTVGNRPGTLVSVERESGNGKTFNVTVRFDGGETKTYFLRTV